MRLVDLSPQWLVDNGERVGFTFLSPTDPKWRQSCFVKPYMRREQWRLFKEAHFVPGGPEAMVQGCRAECKWTVGSTDSVGQFVPGNIENATFDTISVMPSLDGSAGGLWHGHITSGEIKGGL